MKELQKYREKIDALDAEIVKLLGERFETVRAVGHRKAELQASPVQEDRVEEVLNNSEIFARENNLDPEFVRALFAMMIDHAHDVEQAIIDRRNDAA